MYIVSNKAGKRIEADFVMCGRQFPILHIHTHKCSPVQAYQIFGDSRKTTEITAAEKNFVPTQDEELVAGKVYYELKGVEYCVTADKVKATDKTYYEMVDGETVVYRGFTEVQSVGKSPFMPEYGEILIWLSRPITN